MPYWFPQGLHDSPHLLRSSVQQKIAEIEEDNAKQPARRRFDAVVLGYGLCGGGLSGVRAGSIPLVIPRTDDCMGILLGSQERYLDYFHGRQGIYWYTPGWLESANTPCPEYYQEKLQEYLDRFGEDNAQFLMEEEMGWMDRYRHAIYIDSPVCDNTYFRERAKGLAGLYGFEFECVPGSNSYPERLLSGKWDEQSFLTCPSGCRICESNDQRKLMAVPD